MGLSACVSIVAIPTFMQDSSTTTDLPTDTPKFEDRLGELQTIVSHLESGTLGLDEAMLHFERGVSLLRTCFETLEQAEQRIELLTGFDSAKNPRTVPFDATPTADADAASEPSPDAATPPKESAKRTASPDGELLF